MDAVVCKKVKILNVNSLSPNMYASDQDSESTYSESSKSYLELSPPYSSPSQQVPIITTNFTELTCDEKYGKKPYLRIIEQPQNHFRFRYKSEMIGTHGCLLGKSYTNSKTKTHPTVELMHYKGKANIKCRLSDEKSSAEHPHKLLDEDHVRDVSKEVPEDGSYKVAFPGLGIIHTAKKDVPKLLFQKLSENPHNNGKDLHALCENLAKKINLNIVRLMFTAHDTRSGQQICQPVFSEPIHNLKSAATNDLKICRMSRSSGRPRGGEDVFLLVEKVNKNNVEIRFVEDGDDGNEVWSAKGNFMKTDVHHQYAIVFRTPAYGNTQITSDVKVGIELVRPSDGRTSERMEFTYKPDPMLRQNKKRKANSSYSSIGSSSSGSIKSLSDFPTPVLNAVQQSPTDPNNYVMTDISSPFNHNIFTAIPKSEPTIDLANALAEHAHGPHVMLGTAFGPHALAAAPLAPAHAQVHAPSLPSLPTQSSLTPMNSTEYETLLENIDPNPDEFESFRQFQDQSGFDDYKECFTDKMETNYSQNTKFEKIHSQLMKDSGRGKVKASSSKLQEEKEFKKPLQMEPKAKVKTEDYDAFYTNEEGAEVKQLVKEICSSIRSKSHNKQHIKAKLERLIDIRLSNGDTFLHMTFFSNRQSFVYIVKIINSLKMYHLLNQKNNEDQTILHLALLQDMPDMVAFLISKGANPMVCGSDGSTALHAAATLGACVPALAQAARAARLPVQLDHKNSEGLTALHCAVLYKRAEAAGALAEWGGAPALRALDPQARTPLHLAVYDDCLAVVAALLPHTPPEDVDAVCGQGYTALQIVCGSSDIKPNAIAIIKLLLDHKADPMKPGPKGKCAWELARGRREVREALAPHVPAALRQLDPFGVLDELDDDVKSEPEDDYESADDAEESVGLELMSLYEEEVGGVLDGGAWRELARRLRLHTLTSWFENTRSPTRTMLAHLKECDGNVTSKTLAITLEDMGELEAASIIRRYISD